MADEHDPLESELASFRPQPVSLELRERIGAELTRRPVRWVAAVAWLAAAACVVLGIARWVRNVEVVSDPVKPPPAAIVADNSPPTVMDYQRAFAKSSDALDALLARPAGRETRDDNEPDEPVRAFSRSFNDLTNSNGD
jgi:hypothetical protein